MTLLLIATIAGLVLCAALLVMAAVAVTAVRERTYFAEATAIKDQFGRQTASRPASPAA